MTHHIDPFGSVDIRIGELIWPKSFEGNRSAQQQSELMRLIDEAGTGLILDCSMVEAGNSEIISLLMRVRNHAKKSNKEVALFNVPSTLADVIRLCNLRKVLPSAEDATGAKKMISNLSKGKSNWQAWVESNKGLAVAGVAGFCLLAALVFWFFFLR